MTYLTCEAVSLHRLPHLMAWPGLTAGVSRTFSDFWPHSPLLIDSRDSSLQLNIINWNSWHVLKVLVTYFRKRFTYYWVTFLNNSGISEIFVTSLNSLVVRYYVQFLLWFTCIPPCVRQWRPPYFLNLHSSLRCSCPQLICLSIPWVTKTLQKRNLNF
jgi:hypothetical protein